MDESSLSLVRASASWVLSATWAHKSAETQPEELGNWLLEQQPRAGGTTCSLVLAVYLQLQHDLIHERKRQEERMCSM